MIIVRLKGGMGNQMFQYATGRALSLKYNVPLGLDLSFLLDRTPRPSFHKFTFRDYSLDLFNIEVKIVSQSEVPFIYRQHLNGKVMIYINGFLNKFNEIFNKKKYLGFDPSVFVEKKNQYLNGNWQSYKYFEDIRNVICKDFTFKDILPIKVRNLIEVIEKENSLCIHIRRGDYIGNNQYEIVGDEYYKQGVKKIVSLVQVDKIYVFSDDIEWCKKNIDFGTTTMFVEKEYAGIKDSGNLALMSACRYFIIPNSSFSWWGAWLSKREGKIVVAPSKWDAKGFININDIVPKEWIKI